jgi:hypothetical protein
MPAAAVHEPRLVATPRCSGVRLAGDRFRVNEGFRHVIAMATRGSRAPAIPDERYATKAVVGSGSILTIASAKTR